MFHNRKLTALRRIGAGTLILLGSVSLQVRAQDRDRDFDRDRDQPRERLSRIEPGSVIEVRTSEYINSRKRDDRVYTGMVNADVYGANGQVAIPRNSPVELIVRTAHDGDLILDLESVTAYGQRYAIEANADRIDSHGVKKPGAVVG